MGVVIEGGSTELMGVGAEQTKPGHVQVKPVPYRDYNHYRVSGRFNITALTTAGSYHLEFKNGGGEGSLTTAPYKQALVMTRMRFVLTQRTATAAATDLEVDLVKTVNHRTLANSNIVILVPTKKRTPPPGVAHAEFLSVEGPSGFCQQVTAAGNTGGMVGGAYIKEGNTFPMTLFAPATLSTTSQNQAVFEMADDSYGDNPWVLAPNEGFALEVPVQFPNPGSVSVLFDLSWAEAPIF